MVNVGYSELSFILASLVLKYQLTFAASVFRSVSHADSSVDRYFSKVQKSSACRMEVEKSILKKTPVQLL